MIVLKMLLVLITVLSGLGLISLVCYVIGRIKVFIFDHDSDSCSYKEYSLVGLLIVSYTLVALSVLLILYMTAIRL